MKIDHKTIVVTGGGNGLGRELVLSLLSKGAKVIALDKNQLALKETLELAREYVEKLFIYTIDVTDQAAVEDTVRMIIAEHGFVDGLINNAGIIQPFVKFNDLSYEIINRVFNVNLFGMIYLTKAFLPHLITRPQAHIVNISSMGGFLPVPGQTIYCASKAAVKLITEGLNSELSDTSVNVTVVFPGGMNTNIMGNSGLPASPLMGSENMAKILSPRDAADQIIKAMEAGKPRVFVGSDSKFMDKIYRIAPVYAAKLIYKKMSSILS